MYVTGSFTLTNSTTGAEHKFQLDTSSSFASTFRARLWNGLYKSLESAVLTVTDFDSVKIFLTADGMPCSTNRYFKFDNWKEWDEECWAFWDMFNDVFLKGVS